MNIARRKAPNADQQDYQERARALGCVVCVLRIARGMQPSMQCGHTHIHHRNLDDKHGQRQLGQHAVVSLGAWHHDGILLPGWTGRRMREVFGPSFAASPRDFRIWTADVLPELEGRGTARWQAYQDVLLGLREMAA